MLYFSTLRWASRWAGYSKLHVQLNTVAVSLSERVGQKYLRPLKVQAHYQEGRSISMTEPPAFFVSAMLRSVRYIPASPPPQILAIICKFARRINLALSCPGTARVFLGFAPGQFTLSPDTLPEQFPVAPELPLELRGQAGVKPSSKLLGSHCVPEMWQSSAAAEQGTTACHP